jgi:hypothetical protein
MLYCLTGYSQIHILSNGSLTKYSIVYQKHKGYIVLNSGEKIFGVFQYSNMEFPTYNLKYFDDKGKMIKRFKTSLISKAVFNGADSIIGLKDSTRFVRIKANAHFSRQLTKGPIMVYDDLFNIDESPGLVNKNTLIIIFQGRIEKISSTVEFKKLIQQISSIDVGSENTIQSIIRKLNFDQ